MQKSTFLCQCEMAVGGCLWFQWVCSFFSLHWSSFQNALGPAGPGGRHCVWNGVWVSCDCCTHQAWNHRWGYRSSPSSLALRDFLYLSLDLMMITFLPTFKLFFFFSLFLDVFCYSLSSESSVLSVGHLICCCLHIRGDNIGSTEAETWSSSH